MIHNACVNFHCLNVTFKKRAKLQTEFRTTMIKWCDEYDKPASCARDHNRDEKWKVEHFSLWPMSTFICDSWHTQDLADSPQAEISTKCAVIPHWTGSRSSPVYVTVLCKAFNNTFTFNLLHIQTSLSFPDSCSAHLSFLCVKITSFFPLSNQSSWKQILI